MVQSYDELTAGLVQGPRPKTESTKDLEEICRAFLSDDKEVHCICNIFNELEVIIDGQSYNLTLILKNNADLEQVTLTDEEVSKYVSFLNNQASEKPYLSQKIPPVPPETSPTFESVDPTPEEYAKRDPENIHADLLYAEKLAITLYAGEAYKPINDFLRTNGNSEEIRKVTGGDLTLKAKELLLGAVIATRGLHKPSMTPELDDSSDVEKTTSETMKLSRIETLSPLTAERKKAISEGKTSIQQGFTSTSLPNTEDKGSFLKNNKTGSDVTTIHIEQPHSVNPLGKDISRLSPNPHELEVLFTPNTEFKYHDYGRAGEEHSFSAIPVRTIEGQKNNNYSRELVAARKEIISMVYDYKQNNPDKDHIQYARDLLAVISPQTEEKDDKAKHMWQELLEQFVDEQNKSMLRDQITELIPHAAFVFEKFLSTKFPDRKTYPTDAIANIALDETTEFYLKRPNSGIVTSLRMAFIAPSVISYFSEYAADPNFQKFCHSMDAEEIKKMQIAMLFINSGRGSEIKFSDDPKKYMEYAQASANNFANYARSINMAEEDVLKYQNLIQHLWFADDIDKISGASIPNEHQYLFQIMNFSQRLDKLKEYAPADYQRSLDRMSGSVVSSDKQDAALKTLISNTEELIKKSGDRLLTTLQEGELIQTNQPYTKNICFITVSVGQNFDRVFINFCIDTLAKMQKNPLGEKLPEAISKLSDDETNRFISDILQQDRGAIITYLTKKMGVNPNVLNNDGYSLLYIATLAKAHDAMEALIKNGADIFLKNTDGTSPIDLAISNYKTDGDLFPLELMHHVQATRIKETDGSFDQIIDSLNKLNNTQLNSLLLDDAISTENYKFAIDLISRTNIDRNYRAADGKSFVEKATESGNTELIKALDDARKETPPQPFLRTDQWAQRESPKKQFQPQAGETQKQEITPDSPRKTHEAQTESSAENTVPQRRF